MFGKKEVTGYPAVSSCWCKAFIPQKGIEHLLKKKNKTPQCGSCCSAAQLGLLRRHLSHISDKCANNRDVNCY